MSSSLVIDKAKNTASDTCKKTKFPLSYRDSRKFSQEKERGDAPSLTIDIFKGLKNTIQNLRTQLLSKDENIAELSKDIENSKTRILELGKTVIDAEEKLRELESEAAKLKEQLTNSIPVITNLNTLDHSSKIEDTKWKETKEARLAMSAAVDRCFTAQLQKDRDMQSLEFKTRLDTIDKARQAAERESTKWKNKVLKIEQIVSDMSSGHGQLREAEKSISHAEEFLRYVKQA